jgi:hypothetical protein
MNKSLRVPKATEKGGFFLALRAEKDSSLFYDEIKRWEMKTESGYSIY